MIFTSTIFLVLFIASSAASKNDYELLLTYKKYLKVRQVTPPAEKFTLVDMLETTNQRCMKKSLSIYDPGNVPDSEVDRKKFSMIRIIFGKSRDMKEAYAVMLAAPLCNSFVDDYFQRMFLELMAILKNEKYEKYMECFEKFEVNKLEDIEELENFDEDCTEIIGEFSKHYVLNSIDSVRNLVNNHDYPHCIENIAIKIAIYNYKAVVYANTDPLDFNYYRVRRNFVDMMKDSNNDALDCILMDLERSRK